MGEEGPKRKKADDRPMDGNAEKRALYVQKG